MKQRCPQRRQTTPYHSAKNQGQGIVEYVLLLALVGLAVVAIVRVMEPAIADVFQRMVDKNVVSPPSLAGYTPPPTYTSTPTIDPNVTPSPTPTNTPPPTATDTPPVPPTETNTAVPTHTNTPAPPTVTNTPVYLACEYLGSGGTVVMEAENFAHQQLGSPSSSVWAANTTYAGYSGNTAVMVPNTGAFAGATTNGPRLDYRVRLDMAGDYYIFVRGRPLSPNEGSNDSIHAGVDGNAVTLGSSSGFSGFPGGSYIWRRWDTAVTLTEGQHTLNIWMREDGMIIDRVILSTNAGIVSSGSTAVGPANSTAPAGCTGLSAPPPTSTPSNTPTATATSTPTSTPTATATPTQVPDFYIYRDGLQSGWQNWSWGTDSLNLCSTGRVYAGTCSAAVDLGNWGGFSPYYGSFSTNNYQSLSFYIRGGSSGGQQFQVFLWDANGNILTTVSMNNSNYISGGTVSATTWKLVTIPLADLGATNKVITRVAIQGVNNQTLVYIDEMKFDAK